MSWTRSADAGARIRETAGVVGIVATLLLCALAYGFGPGIALWIAAALSVAGNLVYLTHTIARGATGQSRLRWRELMLANLVAAVALAVTLAIAGKSAGLFRAPPGHQESTAPQRNHGAVNDRPRPFDRRRTQSG